ncbi:HD-GYP domain-containing protein [Pseudobacteriovorax antillogorgiicola]|nr:HD domain-containing phosphohydrolase [Pseudobacteriovorax antillogorgiicola]
MVEYIRPDEMSHQLILDIWSASQKPGVDVEVYVLKLEYEKYQKTIGQIRIGKIRRLLDKEPRLDRKILDVFHDLSSASQLILRGGIQNHMVNRASAVVSRLVAELMESNQAVGTLSKMISIDPTLYDHSASVAMLSGIVAQQYQLRVFTLGELETIILAGLYHDSGKGHIPNHILNKPGKFSDSEFAIMKQHASLGHREISRVISQGAAIDPVVALVALEHHERMNGTGYPLKKAGKAEESKNGIHLYSRIVAVADTYSALLMKRVYKPALSAEEAITKMHSFASNHFDEDVFLPFAAHVLASLQQFEEVDTKPISEDSQKDKVMLYMMNGEPVFV